MSAKVVPSVPPRRKVAAKRSVAKEKLFTRVVSVTGGLHASFVFTNARAVAAWKRTKLPELEREHGPLKLQDRPIVPLRVGDRCRVYGEGSDEFAIVELICYEADRYGFVLDSGWTEEVAKCYPIRASSRI